MGNLFSANNQPVQPVIPPVVVNPNPPAVSAEASTAELSVSSLKAGTGRPVNADPKQVAAVAVVNPIDTGVPLLQLTKATVLATSVALGIVAVSTACSLGPVGTGAVTLAVAPYLISAIKRMADLAGSKHIYSVFMDRNGKSLGFHLDDPLKLKRIPESRDQIRTTLSRDILGIMDELLSRWDSDLKLRNVEKIYFDSHLRAQRDPQNGEFKFRDTGRLCELLGGQQIAVHRQAPIAEFSTYVLQVLRIKPHSALLPALRKAGQAVMQPRSFIKELNAQRKTHSAGFVLDVSAADKRVILHERVKLALQQFPEKNLEIPAVSAK